MSNSTLKNAISKVKMEKRLSEINKEIERYKKSRVKEDFNFPSFSDNSIPDLSKDLSKEVLLSIKNENIIKDLLNQIFNYIEVNFRIKSIVKKNIENIIIISKIPYENKIGFLKSLIRCPIIDINRILNTKEDINFKELFENVDDLIIELGNYALLETNYIEGKSSIIGELFLVFFGKGIVNDKYILFNSQLKVKLTSNNVSIYTLEGNNPLTSNMSVGLKEMSNGSLSAYWTYLQLNLIYGDLVSLLKKYGKNNKSGLGFKKIVKLFQDKDNDPELLKNVFKINDYYIVDPKLFNKITNEKLNDISFMNAYNSNIFKELIKQKVVIKIQSQKIEESKKQFLMNCLHFIITARVNVKIRKEVTKAGINISKGNDFSSELKKVLKVIGQKELKEYLKLQNLDRVLFFFVNENIIYESISENTDANFGLNNLFTNNGRPPSIILEYQSA